LTSINTNLGVLAGLRLLRRADRAVDAANQMIATGLRVATALDDASTFAVAQGVRGDIKAWGSVRSALGAAVGVLTVALAAGEMVLGRLAELREKVIAYNGAPDSHGRTVIEHHVLSILNEIDAAVNAATFNDINLVSRGAPPAPPPTPPQPPGFGVATVSGGAGVTINTHAAPATAGTIYIEVNAYGVPDQFEILYNGAVVASTPGQVSGQHVLSFAYPAAPVQEFQVRVTGPQGTAWTYTPYFDVPPPSPPPPPPLTEPAFSVITTIDGDALTVERRNLTTAALGVSSLPLDPPSAGLSALEVAAQRVSEALAYFGGVRHALRGLDAMATAAIESNLEGLGTLVDADLSAAAAQQLASQIRQQLAAFAMSIATESPKLLLQLFK